MPVNRIIFTLFILALALSARASGIRRYVAPVGSGAQDASSWENASPHLQKVIDQSQPGDTVWVARGTFVGGFIMREGVNVIGGFEGNEMQLSQRSIRLEEDGLTQLSGDGKYRVLQQEQAFAEPVAWDGFCLTNGVGSKGAGAFLREGGTLKNCLIEGNTVGNPALGEYLAKEGGILFYTLTNKAYILALDDVDRNFQSERAAEIVKLYAGAGLSGWRLPSAQEMKSLLPTTDALYSSLCLTELALREQKASPLQGKRYWTSTSATSNGLKAAGCCDFASQQYIPLNIYQYNKVRPVRECTLPEVEGVGAGVYAEGGCLMGCQVTGNQGAADIESNGKLEILESSPDAVSAPSAAASLRRVWRTGEQVELPMAVRMTLYDVGGMTISQGTDCIVLPTQPGLYILQWQEGEAVSSEKITIIP